jgi:hypothetical protein
MPFIALGIGIDDMLVVSMAYATSVKLFDGKNDKYKDRYSGDVTILMEDVMAEALPSILFTSLTNFVAFGFASLVPIVVTETFCQLMMIGIVMNVLFIITMFLPMMYFDACRVMADEPRGEFGTVTFCYNKEETSCIPGKLVSTESMNEAKGNGLTASQRFMEYYYGPFLMKPISKVVVLVLAFGFFGVQLGMSLTQLEDGTRTSDLFADGTYQYDFQVPFEQMFGFLPATYVQYSKSFEDPSLQVALQMGAKSLAKTRLVPKTQTATLGSSWVASVVAMGAPIPGDCKKYTINVTTQKENTCSISEGSSTVTNEYSYSKPEEFYPRFGQWLEGLGALSAGSFVCRDDNSATKDLCEKREDGGTFISSKFGTYCRVSCYQVSSNWKRAKAEGKVGSIKIQAVKGGEDVDDLTSIANYKEAIVETREKVDPCTAAYKSGQIKELPGWSRTDVKLPNPDASVWTFCTGYFYQYYEQYVYINDLLRDAMLLSLAGTFVAT